jgi:hypothetical protein
MRETFTYKKKVYPSKSACIAVLLRECKLSRKQIAKEVDVKEPTVDFVIRTIGFDRSKLPIDVKSKKKKIVIAKEEVDVLPIPLIEKTEGDDELILNKCIICGKDFYAEEELEICPLCVETAENDEGGIAA